MHEKSKEFYFQTILCKTKTRVPITFKDDRILNYAMQLKEDVNDVKINSMDKWILLKAEVNRVDAFTTIKSSILFYYYNSIHILIIELNQIYFHHPLNNYLTICVH